MATILPPRNNYVSYLTSQIPTLSDRDIAILENAAVSSPEHLLTLLWSFPTFARQVPSAALSAFAEAQPNQLVAKISSEGLDGFLVNRVRPGTADSNRPNSRAGLVTRPSCIGPEPEARSPKPGSL